MKFHVAKQGETLGSIYTNYYGRIDYSVRWDEGYPYFFTYNKIIAKKRPLKMEGGELILLPESIPLDTTIQPVDLKDVGNT